MLDDLFDRLHAILGAKFADVFNGAEPGRVRDEWSAALADFKPIELERGLNALTQRRFPPTLGEFSCLCRPTLDHEWAFHHARECLMERDQGQVGSWSHPAEWRAAAVMSREVRAGDYSPVRARWKVILERELAKGWGEGVPDAPLKVTHQPSVTRGPTEEERKRLAAMLDSMRGGRDVAAS